MRNWKQNRKGSIYVAVLGASLIVSAIALSAMLVLRTQNRSADALSDRLQAEVHARNAVEWARLTMEKDTSWRTNRANGQWHTVSELDTTLTVDVTDPVDSNLADSPTENVEITGVGTYKTSTQKLRVTLYPQIVPHPLLATAIHAKGNVVVNSGKTIMASGAPLSSNGTVNNQGTIQGSVECQTFTGGGWVTGNVTQNAQAKPALQEDPVALYQAVATTIPFTGNLTGRVLTKTLNPWGSPNTDGVYLLNTGGSNIDIQFCRIEGTLIILCGSSRTVKLKVANFLSPARTDYVTLLTDGHIEFELISGSGPLLESTAGANLNPTGAPYQGAIDTDTSDSYPNEIHGLVHAKGTISLESTTRVVGTVFSEATGTAVVVDANQTVVNYVPALNSNPPMGYRTFQMKVQEGTWTRVAN